MDKITISRRRILAGLGVTGAAAVSGLGVGTSGAVPYTDSMSIVQSDGFTLEADWRETYNDQVLEDSRASETADGAVISLQDVVPGDDGTVSFRLGVDSESDDVSAEPTLSLNLTGTAENGVNDPEQSAGDSSPNTGELQDALQARLWYDEGLADYEVFGGDNATQDPGENLLVPGASGSLAEVAQAVDGVSLGCLGPDETVTVTFGWAFDTNAGNLTQTDSVTFDFEINAEQC